jgi:hypothetical protein
MSTPPKKRGRPRDLEAAERDWLVVQISAALAEVGIIRGSQRARAFMRVMLEGWPTPEPGELKLPPRVTRKALPGSIVRSYTVPLPWESYKKRLQRSRIKPDPDVVKALVAFLQITMARRKT